ncbi:ankyrin repeat family protein [Paraburkholderia fungorum]|uniref:Ankyrin repeat family protein n=1 Tax=Paraburkholderia fungorum TaxID=134537 RepID=A0AAU8T148_9BURK|nr:ankyrin repeat domain-containing protein [Paraburkholderia fungorum]AJZ59912.1 ankyrin repeat family protein [Paraburkholderia fungorum]
MADEHLGWQLSSIFKNDDHGRLKQFFDNVKELAQDGWAPQMAEAALPEASAAKAARCIEFLATEIGAERTWFLNAALMRAVWKMQLDIVKALLPHANVNLVNADGDTPLMNACRGGMRAIVEWMIPYADVDTRGRGQRTALMVAAKGGGGDVLWAILPHANRLLRDKRGYNALMHAIEWKNKEALEILLECCARDEVFSHSRHKWAISAFELAQRVEAQGGLNAAEMIIKEFARREAIEIQGVVSRAAGSKREDASNAPHSHTPRRL